MDGMLFSHMIKLVQRHLGVLLKSKEKNAVSEQKSNPLFACDPILSRNNIVKQLLLETARIDIVCCQAVGID